MKKLIICLLLICTICLGCFALTACNDNTSPDGIPRNTFWKDETLYFDNGVCYAFYYTGEYPKFKIKLYSNNDLLDRYSTTDNNMYFETLSNRTGSTHYHIIKPNTVAYIDIPKKYAYYNLRLEYVAYDYDAKGNIINERIIFATSFQFTQ